MSYRGNDSAEDASSSSGSVGGNSGSLGFRDFLSPSSGAPSELENHVRLSQHQKQMETSVAKTKKLVDARKAITKQQAAGHMIGQEQNNKSGYKSHPLLSKKQQFDGADPQINLNPQLHDTISNEDKKAELTFNYQKRFNLTAQPKFVPPQPKPN